MRRDKMDHTANVRIDTEMLHALERIVAKRNDARARILAENPHRRNLPDVFTVSEVIRHAIKIALEIWEGDENRLRDWFDPVIDRDVKRILVAGIMDPEAGNLLRAMVARDEPQPDFG